MPTTLLAEEINMTKKLIALIFIVFGLQSAPDYIADYLPETSVLKQRHLTEPSSSWLGLLFNSSMRNRCDDINYFLHAIAEGGDIHTRQRDKLGALFCLPCPSKEDDYAATIYTLYLCTRVVLLDQPEHIRETAFRDVYRLAQQLKQYQITRANSDA